MKLFCKCKHKWEVLLDKTYTSKLDEYTKITGRYLRPSYESGLAALTVRKTLVIICCNKCGELKTLKGEV